MNVKIAIAAAVLMPSMALGQEIRTTDVREVCSTPTSEVRVNDYGRRTRIYQKYGIVDHRGYVIDHIISLGLGGADAEANMIPQEKHESYLKDRVEGELYRRVCWHHTLSLPDAQRMVADWKNSYKTLFGVDPQ